MGKAMKQARNREIKRMMREGRIKKQIAYCRGLIDIINNNPSVCFESDRMGFVPSNLVKHACEKFLKEKS